MRVLERRTITGYLLAKIHWSTLHFNIMNIKHMFQMAPTLLGNIVYFSIHHVLDKGGGDRIQRKKIGIMWSGLPCDYSLIL